MSTDEVVPFLPGRLALAGWRRAWWCCGCFATSFAISEMRVQARGAVQVEGCQFVFDFRLEACAVAIGVIYRILSM
eukprot:748546-Pyramimonas_sp.AAC.1